MHTAAPDRPSVPKQLPAAFLALLLLVCCTSATAGQQAPLRLKNLGPAGARTHVTDSWGALQFTLTNTTDHDIDARVVSYYAGAPSVLYGRDVWVPANATIWSWFNLGPSPIPTQRNIVELRTLVYDRTGGQEHLIRSPDGQPLHSELMRYEKREPQTALMIDTDLIEGFQTVLSPRDLAIADETRDLSRVFRSRWTLSPRVNPVKQRFLPPNAEALDGIDHFVLGSNRIADDIAGQQALRGLVERGGLLWIPLDVVEPSTVAALMGDALDLHIVERTSLTNIQLRNGPATPKRPEPEPLDIEVPVEFVRVLAPQQQALFTLDGWPAAFVVELGRGRVLFTALGARGWMRPRTASDVRSPYREYPDLPVALTAFEALAETLFQGPERVALKQEDLRSYVTEQISYSVIRQGSVFLVFGGFFVLLLVAAVLLSKKSLLEHLGWLGPLAALGAGVVFVALGTMERHAVPPTVAVAQIVDAVPGINEVQTGGVLAVFQPELNSASIGAEQGGSFDLDLTGLEGRVYSRIQTDQDRWHWENLELPAGVRTAPFRHTARTDAPVEAIVRFGPNGLEGTVRPGPFAPLEDALFSTPGQHHMAVHLGQDGSLRVGSEDELPPGQMIASSLLTDRQRKRQSLYEKFLAEPQPRFIAGRSLMLAWTDPIDMHFSLVPKARMTGEALVVIPLQFEPTPPGTPVTIPAAFVECRRVDEAGRFIRITTESRLAANMKLRFQVPASTVPLMVERARFSVRLHAPSRNVAIGGYDGNTLVPLRRISGPLGLEHVEITDARLLRLDERGVLLLNLEIEPPTGGNPDAEMWRMESLGLEVHGRTNGK